MTTATASCSPPHPTLAHWLLSFSAPRLASCDSHGRRQAAGRGRARGRGPLTGAAACRRRRTTWAAAIASPRRAAVRGRQALIVDSWSFYGAGIAEFVATFLFLYVTAVLTVMGVGRSPSRCGTVGSTRASRGRPAARSSRSSTAPPACWAGTTRPSTFGLLLARRLSSLPRAAYYAAMQCLGAVCGAGAVKAVAGRGRDVRGHGRQRQRHDRAPGYSGTPRATASAPRSWAGFFSCTPSSRPPKPSAAPGTRTSRSIGLAVFLVHLATIPIAGTAARPLRKAISRRFPDLRLPHRGTRRASPSVAGGPAGRARQCGAALLRPRVERAWRREFGSSAARAGMSCNDGEMKILVFQFVFGDGGISEQHGSFFPSSSVAVVVGGLILAESGGCAVHSEGVFCGDFDVDDVFSGEVIFCAGVLAFYVPSCAFNAHAVIGSVNFTTNDMVAPNQRKVVSFKPTVPTVSDEDDRESLAKI
ncbi:hypothetical protein C2845_PM10G08170 [Panicum miliaceum]|uniref:Uncharacterized protein n=1 Tax=Panicum miliaceum TaxID=4540 RepID=A0A3L6PEF0_PANMI|nr:hypothetical protein C2845_PM10G08170 [Panicum miliaceum]